MLSIQADQIRAIENTQLDGYVQRAQDFIREHFPDVSEMFGDAAVATQARLAVGRGNLYDMPSEIHVTQFLVLMLLLGPDFDTDLPESPTIQQELAKHDCSPDERLERVFALVAPHYSVARGA